NGYVRSEGIAMLVLKKLSDAERDRDHIYGVVRSAVENHGGRANSLTAPNPTAQTNLVKDALQKAQIDPRTISYIEAHGTGTKLGDPVEISALKAAFKDMYAATGASTVQEQQCGIGSVKSNIGHLELAAGVAGVIKVLLQMKHKTLVKSLHCDTVNPYIDFSGSPFYVVQQACEWPAMADANGSILPRRAGVSSFGFGGVNAHVILEEYVPAAVASTVASGVASTVAPVAPPAPALVVLSARNVDRLQEQVQLLLKTLNHNLDASMTLADLAFTLQVGREAMEERLAMVVDSFEELRDKLTDFANGQSTIPDLYRGQVKRNKEALSSFVADEDMSKAIHSWIQKEKFGKVLAVWVKGMTIDWNALYEMNASKTLSKPSRVSLPTYPFARERYWVGGDLLTMADMMQRDDVGDAILHPLLHRNTSDLSVQRYSSRFTGQEFFLNDHVVQGKSLLPAVVQLEMARSAVLRSIGLHHTLSLSKVVWTRPVVVGAQGLEVHIALLPQAKDSIQYEIYSEDKEGAALIYSQGCVLVDLIDGGATPAQYDIASLRQQCALAHWHAAQCYAMFETAGIRYGSGFQGLSELFVGEGKVLAKISLPISLLSSLSAYQLHPSLLDAALQASLGLQVAMEAKMAATGKIELMLPFALEGLEVLAACSVNMWAVVAYSEGSQAGQLVQKLDIDLCDEEGHICVRFKQFSLRRVESQSKRALSNVDDTNNIENDNVVATAKVQHNVEPLKLTQLENAQQVSHINHPTHPLLREKSILKMRALISRSVNMSVDEIDPNVSFDKYGIDSILVTELSNSLRDIFGADSSVSTTLFFEHQNIADLVEYFIHAETAALMRWTGLENTNLPARSLASTSDRVLSELIGAEDPTSLNSAHLPQTPPSLKPILASSNRFRSDYLVNRASTKAPAKALAVTASFDVAIVGLAGRYPLADNVNQFWDNLVAGRNCVSEVPPERWESSKYFDAQNKQLGKAYTKWAGFLNDVDRFDHLFFNITPSEAEIMSPQERQFIQQAYASIEDAGYTPASLSQSRKVGLFVGVMNEHYPTGGRYWSMANRVSYMFNFQGPSMAVDTACSSALTAVHLALESLRSGSSEIAVAGGVNLIVSPNQLSDLSAMAMLSHGDKCKAFAADGDGFVDGEAVGAIVLKPLQQAIEDGDHIYGVIKGSAVNAGGKTNGYMVPNPNLQAQLVQDALQGSGVDARQISYVEAQGTGSNLGDPIEIAGLSKAFKNWTTDKQFCAIGSAKSNVGHTESASGFVAISKVLMQMKHKTLVPSLHCAVLNPNIDFANSPFVVQQELGDWVRPILNVDGQSREIPRIAGISSFGAGGANAHVVIEEYISVPTSVENPDQAQADNKPVMVVLSARNSERLQVQVQLLLKAIEPSDDVLPSLLDLTYTLQVGREAMEERLALVVTSLAQLREKLSAIAAGVIDVEAVYRGRAKRSAVAAFTDDEDMRDVVQKWLAKAKFEKVLDLWVKGLALDWNSLYSAEQGIKPKRISLPTYPFEARHSWVNSRYPNLPDTLESVARYQEKTPVLPSSSRGDAINHEVLVSAEKNEEIMLSIWRELFGRDSLDVDDNFFELGGHSLLATQLSSRIRVEFGIDVSESVIFQAPTVTSLILKMNLPAHRTDLLVSKSLVPTVQTIPAIPRHGPLPVSFAQQRLWILDQLDGHNPLYNIAVAVRFTGILDQTALTKTLNEIVRRHEALRTKFEVVGDLPMQIFADALHFTLEVTDLSALPPSEREARARWLIQDEAQTPFDLVSEPLIRSSILRLADDVHVVLLTMHHIVSDGWSMNLVVREMSALYTAFVQDRPSPLAELPIQYADFAVWQRQWLGAGVLEQQLAYWQQQLADIPSVLALPTDRARPLTPSNAGASLPLTISPTLAQGLQKLSQQTQSSLFMTLCATFNLLLARYTGQSDICIGTPIANRTRVEIENLIGFFVNTLVLRTQVNLDSSFESLLDQVRQHTLAAYAHQDVPFEQLVESLQPQRLTGCTPMFQVMFVFHNTPVQNLNLPDLSLQLMESETGTAKFDLTLTLTDYNGVLQGSFEYATDLFDAATVARMAEHFTRLLEGVVSNPGCPVGDLDMLG
ncbi:MAG: polyketide synthase dehydratase domain-containing protein, partial [Undibacterium sp.]|nr:polyketide synthase dehydratase domain-containing protein [Undibacterium sp.]